MIFNTEDNGTILTEENVDIGREISLVVNHEGYTMYYVALEEKTKFRSAGIVDNLQGTMGVKHLIEWVGGKDWNPNGLFEGRA
jgi:hypothetical protein